MNNKVKNILYLSRPLSNTLDEGSKNLVYALCKKIKRNVIVIVEKNCSLNLSKTVKKYKIVIKIDSSLVENSRSFLVKIELLKAVLKFREYSLIHTFFTLTKANVLLLIFTYFILNKRIIINVPALDRDRMKSTLIKLLLKITDVVLVMSQYSMNYVAELNSNVRLIPPTIDEGTYSFISYELKKKIRRNLNLNSKFIIIFPGEYSRLEASENIIEIINTIAAEKLDVLFIIACRLKTEADKLIQINIKKILAQHNVLFLNTVSNYYKYAAASDIGLFPVGSMDGKFDLPLALVELMAMGKPVIHTDIQPLDELYQSNEGFCYTNNTKIIATRLIEIINDNKLLEELTAHTIFEAKRFLPINVIPKYHEIYDEYFKN